MNTPKISIRFSSHTKTRSASAGYTIPIEDVSGIEIELGDEGTEVWVNCLNGDSYEVDSNHIEVVKEVS